MLSFHRRENKHSAKNVHDGGPQISPQTSSHVHRGAAVLAASLCGVSSAWGRLHYTSFSVEKGYCIFPESEQLRNQSFRCCRSTCPGRLLCPG